MPSLAKIFYERKASLITSKFRSLLGISFQLSFEEEKLVLKNINPDHGQEILQEEAQKIRKLSNKQLNVTVRVPVGFPIASFVINDPLQEVIHSLNLTKEWNESFKDFASDLIKSTVKGLKYTSSNDYPLILNVSPHAEIAHLYDGVEALRAKGLDVTMEAPIRTAEAFLRITIDKMSVEDVVHRFYNPQKNAEVSNDNNNNEVDSKKTKLEELLKQVIVDAKFTIDLSDPVQIHLPLTIKTDFFNYYATKFEQMGLKIQAVSPAPMSGAYFTIHINNSVDEILQALTKATGVSPVNQIQPVK